MSALNLSTELERMQDMRQAQFLPISIAMAGSLAEELEAHKSECYNSVTLMK